MYYVNFLEKGPTEYKQYINQRQQGGKKGRVRKKVKLKQNTNLKSMLLLILGN